jgi:ribosomal protein S18 acetylase RimI-like enzyme
MRARSQALVLEVWPIFMAKNAMLAIRPADLGDLDALVAIETRAFATDRLSRRSFSRLIVAPTATVLVADAGAEVMGYALVLYRAQSRVARLYSIAVSADRVARGVGRALLAAAEEAACTRGCEAMRLEVHASNRRAAQLYERAGYVAFGHVDRYYEDGGTAVRYEKRWTARKAV